jgi:hypothetical protein
MAFADPQSITINAVPVSLPLVEAVGQKSIYSSADETMSLTLSQQKPSGRRRRLARIDSTVIAADPLTAQNESKDAAVYIVIDQPNFGFSDAEINHLVQGLSGFLTEANVLKLLGGEH